MPRPAALVEDMTRFAVTVHLSSHFRDTSCIRSVSDFDEAAASGAYDGAGSRFEVEAGSHVEAAEVAFAVCNSYPDEMHAGGVYLDVVKRYRNGGNRSLSVGDLVMVSCVDSPSGDDGRYGCARAGFIRF